MMRHSIFLLLLALHLSSASPSTTGLLDVILSGAQSVYSDTFPSGSTNLAAFQSDASSILGNITPSTTAASSSASSTSSSSSPSSTLATSTTSRPSTTSSHATTAPPTTAPPDSSKQSTSLPGTDTSNQGLIFGLALGIPLGLLALALLALALFLRHRRQRKRREADRLIAIDSPIDPPTGHGHDSRYPPMAFTHHRNSELTSGHRHDYGHEYSHGHSHGHEVPAPPPQMMESNSRSSQYYTASTSNSHNSHPSHHHGQEGESLLTPSHPSTSPDYPHPGGLTSHPSHGNDLDAYGARSQHPHHLSNTSTQPSSYSDSLLGSPTSPAEMEGSSFWSSLPIPRRSSKRKRPTTKKFHYPFSPTSEEVSPLEEEPGISSGVKGHERSSSSVGRSGTGGSGKWFAGLVRSPSSALQNQHVAQQSQMQSPQAEMEEVTPLQRPRRISEIRRKPVGGLVGGEAEGR